MPASEIDRDAFVDAGAAFAPADPPRARPEISLLSRDHRRPGASKKSNTSAPAHLAVASNYELRSVAALEAYERPRTPSTRSALPSPRRAAGRLLYEHLPQR